MLYFCKTVSLLNNNYIYCIYLLFSTRLYFIFLLMAAFALFENLNKNFLHFLCLLFTIFLLTVSLILPLKFWL